MALVTRLAKRTPLTIEEMDGNLIHLNNNPLLLGKITANLNLDTVAGNPQLVTSCMDTLGILFVEGENLTFNLEKGPYGTAKVVRVTPNTNTVGESLCGKGQSQYLIELENVDFLFDSIPDGLSVTGNTSGAAAQVISISSTKVGVAQPINLNPLGSLFKINEIVLTGINGTPAPQANCYVKTSAGGGKTIARLSGSTQIGIGDNISLRPQGVSELIEPDQWINMSLGESEKITSAYNYLVGNTVYFSADAPAGSECTVDVYVFGYTLQ